MKKVLLHFLTLMIIIAMNSCNNGSENKDLEEATPCTITFFANNGTDDFVTQEVIKGQLCQLDENPFIYGDRDFLGWTLSDDSTEIAYGDKAITSFSSDCNLYALWGEETTIGKVILHANFGDDQTKTLEIPYSNVDVIQLEENIFTREGYRIMGWSTVPDGEPNELSGNYIQPGLTWITNKKTIHYYCMWQNESTYTLTFYPNYEGATEEPIQKEFQRTNLSNTKIKVGIWEPFLFKREGYKLLGWIEGSTLSPWPNKYYHGQELEFSKDTKLYAIWVEENSDSYVNYTYYCNDEKAGLEDEERMVIPTSKNNSMGYPPSLFSREGYILDGWAKERDSKNFYAPYYSIGASDIDTNVYAIWHKTHPEITFKANFENSDYEDYKQVTEYNKSVQIEPLKFEREGYTFIGWSLAAEDSYPDYEKDSTIKILEDSVLYAIWKKNPIVTFTANYEGATESDVTQTLIYDEYVTLDSVKFTREGYFFMGFSTSPESTSASYKEGSSICLTEDIILYAVWAAPITITYNSNYKSGNNQTISYTYPEGTTVSPADCSFEAPEGFYFYGWVSSTSISIENVQYNRFDKPRTFSEDKNYYATWAPVHTVLIYSNYDGKGGSEEIKEYKIKYGEKLTFEELFTENAPEGTNLWSYGLKSKVSDPIGSSYDSHYLVGEYYSFDRHNTSCSSTTPSTYIFYAQWRKPLTILFKANYEGANPESFMLENIPYGTEINTPSPWDRSDELYYFAGWSQYVQGSGSNNLAVYGEGTITLYAAWEPPCKIIYYSGTASNEEFTDYCILYGDYTVIDYMFETTVEGKTFAGWSTYQNSTTVNTKVGSKITNVKSNEKLYAVWE